MRDIAADQDQHWFETYGKVALTGEPKRFEAFSTPLNRWWSVYAFRIADPKLRRVAVLFADITARKWAEERQKFLLKLSDSLRPLADPIAIEVEATRMLGEQLGVDRTLYAEVEPDEDHIFINRDYAADGVASISGRQQLSSFGSHWVDGYREGRTCVTSDFREISGSSVARFEKIGVRACVGVPVKKDGRLVGVLIVHSATPRQWTPLEVTLCEETTERTWAAVERAKAQAELRASEVRLAAAFEALPVGVGFVEPDGSLTLANREMLEYLPSGFIPSRDPSRSTRWRAWHPDGQPVALNDFPGARASRGERVVSGLEMLYLRDDGTEVWTRVSAIPVRDAEGRVLGCATVITDIDGPKRAESALRESEARLRAVATSLPNAAVFVVGSDFRYELAEGQALKRAGFAPTDLEGRTVVEAMGPELAPEYEPMYRRALAGEVISIEHASHGRHYATHLGPLVGEQGRTLAALAVSYDITDRVRAEEEVLRAKEELESRVVERTIELEVEMNRRRDLVRQLGTAQEDERRRVARDLHDSVGQLLASLSLALKGVELAVDLTASAAAELGRAQGILDALGRELHGLAVRLRPTSLDDLGLEPALQQLVAEWSARSGVRAEFQSSGIGPGRLPPEVETTIYRVVQEALTNVARHAGARVVGVVVVRPDRHVTAVIEDDGAGFDLNAAPPGRLGLKGMRERVDLVGGELDVESSPGLGTTIFVRIPLPGGGTDVQTPPTSASPP